MVMTNLNLKYFNGTLSEFLRYDSFVSMQEFIQHADVSCLEHSVAVAYLSYRIANRLNMRVDSKSLIRGALLHDFFLYDWHDRNLHNRFHGFRHPFTALNNAKKQFSVNYLEEDIIKHHMFPLVPYLPSSKEALIVSTADKICSFCEATGLYPRFFTVPSAVSLQFRGLKK